MEVARTSPEENLESVRDTVAYLAGKGSASTPSTTRRLPQRSRVRARGAWGSGRGGGATTLVYVTRTGGPCPRAQSGRGAHGGEFPTWM